MSHRKLQKEVEALFKKIQEGIEQFNYYHSRHEASNNESQREKLEGDLKKEIKKLQKFREQIKSWQSNDAMEAVITPSKLQEHRRLVEESMEVYKEVEKNSKMKSFSNQSIMLAALEGDEEQEELSPDTIEAIEFLDDCNNQLDEQIGQLEEEYEKLSEKKPRKNTLHVIEERKQEIESLTQRNNFHMDKITSIIEYLKSNKLDPELVWMIQDDLNFYIESNQEPDFIDDDTLYDELFKEVAKNKEREPKPKENINDKEEESNSPSTNLNTQSTVNVPKNLPMPKPLISTPQRQSTPISTTPDLSSPAIIKNLKPATTPSKPVGKLKWAAAAAGAPNVENHSVDSLGVNSKPEKQSPELKVTESRIKESSEIEIQEDSNINGNNDVINDPKYEFVEVLRNSQLSKAELELFSDLNLIAVPPGIQDLVISFTSVRNPSSDSRLLLQLNNQSHFNTSIYKPYLPKLVQYDMQQDKNFKPALRLSKLQSYWNKIRANDQFDQCIKEIQLLSSQNNQEHIPLINELTFVLFYGFYYGLTPLENLIAESCLFQLGWKPYGSKTADIISDDFQNQGPGRFQSQNTSRLEKNQFYHWFKCIKLLSNQTSNSFNEPQIEVGDFQVFDLTIWDIYIKHGFKLDLNLCQLEPLKNIC